jgi:hypothetical protein
MFFVILFLVCIFSNAGFSNMMLETDGDHGFKEPRARALSSLDELEIAYGNKERTLKKKGEKVAALRFFCGICLEAFNRFFQEAEESTPLRVSQVSDSLTQSLKELSNEMVKKPIEDARRSRSVSEGGECVFSALEAEITGIFSKSIETLSEDIRTFAKRRVTECRTEIAEAIQNRIKLVDDELRQAKEEFDIAYKACEAAKRRSRL